jgi:hypothetical protein
MPVTAKLSRKFYDQFGDEIANELVEWFNKVDETYRTELRELNELNYARFDAKLEQRIAELRSTLREEMAELQSGLRVEMAGLQSGFREELADLGSTLRREAAEMGFGLRAEIAALGDKVGERITALELRVASERVSLIRWMVGLWAAQITLFVGTVLVVLRAG